VDALERVLGFVGLPTLGFQLDTFFKQGLRCDRALR